MSVRNLGKGAPPDRAFPIQVREGAPRQPARAPQLVADSVSQRPRHPSAHRAAERARGVVEEGQVVVQREGDGLGQAQHISQPIHGLSCEETRPTPEAKKEELPRA